MHTHASVYLPRKGEATKYTRKSQLYSSIDMIGVGLAAFTKTFW